MNHKIFFIIIFFIILILFIIEIFIYSNKNQINVIDSYFAKNTIDTNSSNNVELPKVIRNRENVKIEVLNNTITKDSAEILITDNNETPYYWESRFRVQKKINDNLEAWEDLQFLDEEPLFDDILYNKLDENNQLKFKIEYGKYYGALNNGTYRIMKSVYDYSTNKFIDFFSNEFEIK